jgi:chlorobactene glucosyltransferase
LLFTPPVTVIVPARNEQDCIKRCLSSLLWQNYPNLEVIMIDDNSTDKTSQVAKTILDRRLKIISLNKTPAGWSGKSWASQVGYLASSGKILLFTDADTCFFDVEAVSRTVSFMAEKQAVVVTGQPLIELNDMYSKLVMPLYNFFNELYTAGCSRLQKKGSSPHLIGSFFMINKKILDSLGGFICVQSSINEDTDLGIHISRAGHPIKQVKANKFMSAMWSRDKKTLLEGIKRIISGNLIHNRMNIALDLMSVIGLVLVPFILLPFTFSLQAEHGLRALLLSWNYILCLLPIIGLALISKKNHDLNPLFSLLVFFSSGLYLLIYLTTISRFILPLPLSTPFIRWKARQYIHASGSSPRIEIKSYKSN